MWFSLTRLLNLNEIVPNRGASSGLVHSSVLESPHVAVIVPAYNEELRLVASLERMREYLDSRPWSYSVTVVDDGSTDQTRRIAEEFARQHPQFFAIGYGQNRGKGHAVRYGMLRAEGAYLLLSDADLAAPIEEVEKLLAAVSNDVPIAIGSRPLARSSIEIHQPKYREIMGRMANKLIQWMGIRGIRDTQCGFKLYEAGVARKIFSRCKLDGFSFDFEALMIAIDLGYRIAEVPIRWAHQEGSKVVFWRDYPRALRDLVRLRLAGKHRRLTLNGAAAVQTVAVKEDFASENSSKSAL